MILPKEKLHVYLFMPLRPIGLKSRAANLNSLNSVIFAERELELKKIKFLELELEQLNSDLQISLELR